MKVAVTFEYDRYICGQTSSVAIFNNTYVNTDPTSTSRVPMSPQQAGTAGVAYRPSNLTPTEAIVQGELYTGLTGDQKW